VWESVVANCKTFVEELRKKGKKDDEIKVEEEQYMKDNWTKRFCHFSIQEHQKVRNCKVTVRRRVLE